MSKESNPLLYQNRNSIFCSKSIPTEGNRPTSKILKINLNDLYNVTNVEVFVYDCSSLSGDATGGGSITFVAQVTLPISSIRFDSCTSVQFSSEGCSIRGPSSIPFPH